ncbi:ATP-dependent 23S rRNA helicase DbpA [hydrothermal vent metagenome]|uniref:ATP-dependent 23S rRNA helicase DbpA n=1 Tax=hydrothermal vent metagenome TaxID=652676 RepID=A0A3B0WBJ9_9ZZZZ
MNQTPFSSVNLDPELLKNLTSLGYESMTPIQEKSLPPILSGKDVIAQGKTGSGKTAAFGIGLLDKLEVKRYCVQSLVLCPTRELADQVAKEIRRLARAIHNIKVLTLCGGMPFGPQIGSLEHGAHIIVGTPGRIEEHLRKQTLKLDQLNMLVIDEADRMLEMGFQSAMDAIVDQTPAARQTLLFSATFPKQIKFIADRIMVEPTMVQVTSTHDEVTIKQHFYKVDNNEERLTALRLLLLHHRPESSVIFCNTKKETQEIADTLFDYGFSALALHGDLEQRDRDQALVRFANKSVSVLVATDVASRGLDVDSINLVINYHIARDTEVYIHRIGRTGRAGKKGIACSLFSDKESYKVALLGDYLDKLIEGETLPSSKLLNEAPADSRMATILIDGGKKQKVRPGDILGALTGKEGIAGKQVGKIHVFDNRAYVAVDKKIARVALKKLSDGKLKGRSFRARLMQN